METQKPKVITEFVKISQELQQQIKLEYPEGFVDELIRFPYKGEMISALRFETDEKVYLLKMTKARAQEIIDDDDDYDDDGTLKDDVREDFEEKYGDDDVVGDDED